MAFERLLGDPDLVRDEPASNAPWRVIIWSREKVYEGAWPREQHADRGTAPAREAQPHTNKTNAPHTNTTM